ncbi:MAG: SOS response-associated peptidase [Betaproteobacteria bacterium]
MCGRYVSPEEAEIERFWHVGRHNNSAFQRRFNVSPTQSIPILRLDRETGEIELVNARWGLIPNWWKDAKPPRTTHNARAEEAATKPMWKGPLARSRCLIPAVGWYEWKTLEQPDPETGEIKQVKQPHFFHLPDNQLFSFAGILATWKAPDQDVPQLTCALLSQDSVGPAAEVHERMPIVLTREMESVWLDPKNVDAAEVVSTVRKASVIDLAHYAVSTRVNASKVDEPSLIEKQD